MAAATILDFEKLSLVFDRSPPKLVETLGLPFGTYQRRRKYIFAKVQDDCCHHLEF